MLQSASRTCPSGRRGSLQTRHVRAKWSESELKDLRWVKGNICALTGYRSTVFAESCLTMRVATWPCGHRQPPKAGEPATLIKCFAEPVFRWALLDLARTVPICRRAFGKGLSLPSPLSAACGAGTATSLLWRPDPRISLLGSCLAPVLPVWAWWVGGQGLFAGGLCWQESACERFVQ